MLLFPWWSALCSVELVREKFHIVYVHVCVELFLWWYLGGNYWRCLHGSLRSPQ